MSGAARLTVQRDLPFWGWLARRWALIAPMRRGSGRLLPLSASLLARCAPGRW